MRPNPDPTSGKFNMRSLLLFLAILALPLVEAAQGWQPAFSYMTLNGIPGLALSIEDIHPDLVPYGLTHDSVAATARVTLTKAGIPLLTWEEANQEPQAALLRVRTVTNRDAQGFYHLSVKLEVRKKIPLGNPAGGFVSQVVWSTAENGVILANEVEKVESLIASQLAVFIADYRAENQTRAD
jgi:hypothetical protein